VIAWWKLCLDRFAIEYLAVPKTSTGVALHAKVSAGLSTFLLQVWQPLICFKLFPAAYRKTTAKMDDRGVR